MGLVNYYYPKNEEEKNLVYRKVRADLPKDIVKILISNIFPVFFSYLAPTLYWLFFFIWSLVYCILIYLLYASLPGAMIVNEETLGKEVPTRWRGILFVLYELAIVWFVCYYFLDKLK